MNCDRCGEAYTVAGNSEDGYLRTLCSCAEGQKCFKCKRGDRHSVNQALLDLDFEVRHYACARHGHLEAESFAVPAAKAKPKKAVTIQPELPKPVAAPPPKKATPPKPVASTHDFTTLEGFTAELKASRDYVICLHCFIVQRFCDFKTQLDAHGLPEALCMRCGKGYAKATGKSW